MKNYTPKEAAEAYYQYYKTKDDQFWWAVDLQWELTDVKEHEARFEFICALLENAPYELDYLGSLGAGILEETNIESLIQALEKKGYSRDSEFDKKLCIALQTYRLEFESPEYAKTITDYIHYHFPDWEY
jgi:hypothetical protein